MTGLPFSLTDVRTVDVVTAVRIAKQYAHLHGKIPCSGVERDRDCLCVCDAATVHGDFIAGGAGGRCISVPGGGGRDCKRIRKLEDHVVFAIGAARPAFNTGIASERQRNFKCARAVILSRNSTQERGWANDGAV